MFGVEPAVNEPAEGLGGQHQIGVRPALAGDEFHAVRRQPVGALHELPRVRSTDWIERKTPVSYAAGKVSLFAFDEVRE
jgi:hypothetical protein